MRNGATPPGDMPPVALRHHGHRTRIKWHRARRRATDPVFTATRLIEAMRVGASVEIDLVIHADRGFAVLHDRTVDVATTGVGRIADLRGDELRALFLRDNDGRPLQQRVLLLEDLAQILTDAPLHPDALLQLDFKEDAAALDDKAIAIFADAVAPFAANAILSCGDSEAVRILTEAAPGIRIGYDPCHHGASEAVLRHGDYAAFADRAVAASPDAEMVYLERRVIAGADRLGVDIIDEFHRRARNVDAYTVYTVDSASVREVTRLLELRVDQITTDDPEGLYSAFTSGGRESHSQ